MGTWDRSVSVYVALTQFARAKFIEGGLPADRIVIKPNFAFPVPPGSGDGEYDLFIGRLSAEKGLHLLLDARRHMSFPLKIVGDGPASALVESEAAINPYVQWLGRRNESEVSELIGNARIVAIPSTWYEGLPRVLIEAFRGGTPVIAPGHGPFPDLIRASETGELFEPGDSGSLLLAFRRLESVLRTKKNQVRCACRAEYEAEYTPAANYKALMDIYGRAVAGYGRASITSRQRQQSTLHCHATTGQEPPERRRGVR
jgi:glycosyltransferase involved in cell wall biosynthesis